MNEFNIYSHFEPKEDGHGGERRSFQIKTLFENAELRLHKIPTGHHKLKINISTLYNFFSYLQIYINLLNTLKSKFNLKKIIKKALWILKLEGIDELDKPLIYETSNFSLPHLIFNTKKNKRIVIACPHNIESLVPNQFVTIGNESSPYTLYDELRLLKFCDVTFCISKEETLLLQQFGVNAFYLPYYPSKRIVNDLVQIRNNRIDKKNNAVKKLLILGSIVNNPTKEGIIELLNFFKQKDTNCKIYVVGYGSEELKESFKIIDKIEILGSLSHEKLNELLTEVDAAIIHQPPTSGALTRITELLIAGIPIICNFSSARNYYDLKGVYVYQNIPDLINLLNVEFVIPDFIPYPEKECNHFISTIKNYNNEKNTSNT